MSRCEDIMEAIKSTTESISPCYDMSIRNMKDIYENSKNSYDLIFNGFRFGYLQGMKAAKDEMKGGAAV